MALIRWLILIFLLCLMSLELFWLSSSVDQRYQWIQRWPLSYFSLQVNQALLPQLAGLKTASRSLPDSAQWQNAGEAEITSPARFTHSDAQTELQRLEVFSDLHAASGGCYKPPTLDVADVQSSGVYRWTDDAGQVHFSDRPQHRTAENLSDRYRDNMQGVRVSFTTPGWSGDSLLASNIRKEAALLYRILTQFIPRPSWRQINLNITLFADKKSYAQYRQSQGGNTNWAAFYSHGQNHIYMERYANSEQTLVIARHEMTHAMLAGMLGTLPIWLNEGLAEYMEGLNWQMNSARISLDLRHWQWLLQQASSPTLVFELDGQSFNGADQTLHYRQSAALVFFLLGHSDGQRWLRQTLAYYAAQPCAPFDAEQAFADYPGGLPGLSVSYRRWLKNRPAPHYY